MKIDFHIPDEYQNIGLLFSGGMDSSLLLYMLGKHYPNRRIMAFTAGCDYIDNRLHLNYANKVFDRTANLLSPGALDYHITHYHDDRTTHHCNQAMKEFETMVDLWVVGVNPAPPAGSLVKNCYGELVDVHEFCHITDRLKLTEKMGQNQDYIGRNPETGHVYFRPLINYDKKAIVDLYHIYGIYSSILPLTRSCPKVWEHKDMSRFTPECGWCFFCLERKWGLQS